MGEIVDINSFPVKSCAPIKKQSAQCDDIGIRISDYVHDRVFMITTIERQFVTARTYPKLVLIQPSVSGSKLTLILPDGPSVSVDVEELLKRETGRAHVWQQPVDVVDAGDEAAQFISSFILGDDVGLRLVFFPKDHPTRECRDHFKSYKKYMQKNDSSAFADATGYMLINQASMDDLNARLGSAIKPLQFRPNFVVKGPEAFAEDKWAWVRIGDQVLFRGIKPCTR